MNGTARLRDLLGIAVPVIHAPMAGATTPAMVVGAMRGGGLGSLPCAMLTPEQTRTAVANIRSEAAGPFNLNFFCHRPPVLDPEREQRWRALLAPYHAELGLGLDPESP